jgi:transcriptional regulator with XRE-family HTH domain
LAYKSNQLARRSRTELFTIGFTFSEIKVRKNARRRRKREWGEGKILTPGQCKAARKLLRWSQDGLAAKLFLSSGDAIRDFESRTRLPWSLHLRRLQEVFEEAGVEFTDDEAGVRFARAGITGQQVAAARKLLGWTQKQLSDRANVRQGTINRLELGVHVVPLQSLAALRRTLELAGVEFREGHPPQLRPTRER